MKAAKDVIPWKVTDLPLRPYEDLWSFNPSIAFDGQTWRCVLRCADYSMPDGRTVRAKGARSTGQQTKNAMAILDPATWRPIQIYKMREEDGLPRASTPHVGFEDMRIFRTDAGGLQGIAASLHLKRAPRSNDGRAQNQPPEQVLLSFDGEYNIVGARPIRGDAWSGTPQKNWVPFDHCAEPRFLYSIGAGRMFDTHGPVSGDAAVAKPSSSDLAPARASAPAAAPAAPTVEAAPMTTPSPEPRKEPRKEPRRATHGRVMIDASISRPSSYQNPARPRSVPAAHSNQFTRVTNTSRARLPGYAGLRGGSQLVHVGNGDWLGIGHEMKWVDSKKFYYHSWYLVDSSGKMKSMSESMKLASNGIEFAAGMAIDGDRVVVSFGVDDAACKIGETSLSAVIGTLRPI